MLIRSQKRGLLINFDNSPAIGIMEVEGDVRITCSDTDETFDIGHYSTKEKALKVLDMIQEAYADFEATKTISTGLVTAVYTGSYDTPESIIEALKGYAALVKEAVVFQMPADSEVEV